jgi:hypothetical protein
MIGVDTDAEGRPPHTIDVDVEDGHIYFYDLKDVAEAGERPLRLPRSADL